MMKEKLLEKFQDIYGDTNGTKVYFAPGRVNLIGEHIDYSGGLVLPCALTLGTYGVARKRGDKKIKVYSMNMEDEIQEIAIGDYQVVNESDWTNYIKGVLWAFKKKEMVLPFGMDLLLFGDLPSGAGLSSSASLEVLIGFIMRDLYGFDVTNVDLALIGQQAEHEFCGVNCGIMDQFAVAMGKKDHALLLNTKTLDYEYIPITLCGVKLIIANSNKKHKLGESKYNERREECETALEEISQAIGIHALCDLDEKTWNLYQVTVKDDDRKRRVKHAVTENARTKQAAAALKNGELKTFGELMKASHQSLSEDYEVTGDEMDALAEAAWQQDGVLGSRMTGGGFGGSTISLVEENFVDEFIQETGRIYTEKTGLSADFYVVEIGDGPVVQ